MLHILYDSISADVWKVKINYSYYNCLYLLGCSNSLIPFHLKTAILWELALSAIRKRTVLTSSCKVTDILLCLADVNKSASYTT
jgi:hypothetical protein